jgi:hypothetical protein
MQRRPRLVPAATTNQALRRIVTLSDIPDGDTYPAIRGSGYWIAAVSQVAGFLRRRNNDRKGM